MLYISSYYVETTLLPVVVHEYLYFFPCTILEADLPGDHAAIARGDTMKPTQSTAVPQMATWGWLHKPAIPHTLKPQLAVISDQNRNIIWSYCITVNENVVSYGVCLRLLTGVATAQMCLNTLKKKKKRDSVTALG